MRPIQRVLVAAIAVACGLGLLSPSPLSAAELVMFDAKDCGVCLRFNKEAAPHYDASAAARVFPLRRIDVNTGTVDVTLELPVTMTPTFVFVDKGVELARFYGYPGRKHFFELVNGVADEFRKIQAEAKPR